MMVAPCDEVELDVALEADGEAEVVACGEVDCASSGCGCCFDGLVDGGGVEGLAVAGGSEGADVEEGGRGWAGRGFGGGEGCGSGDGGEGQGAELEEVATRGADVFHRPKIVAENWSGQKGVVLPLPVGFVQSIQSMRDKSGLRVFAAVRHGSLLSGGYPPRGGWWLKSNDYNR